MTLPNFLVLGPPRTATTWLFRCIYQHPQIYLPEIKEVHYFDEHYERGLAWYASLFKNAPAAAVAVGDITPSYYAHPEAPARIRQTLGERIKLFVVFRDPVERAFSEYRMKKGSGIVKGSFLEALQADRRLVENSLYAKNLQRFREYFPDECFSILPYRVLNEDPFKYVGRFLETLGVRIEYRQEVMRRRINEGMPEVRFSRLYDMSLRLRERIEAFPLGRRLLWLLRERGVVKRWHSAVSEGGGTERGRSDWEAAYAYFVDDLAKLRLFAQGRFPEIGVSV